MKIPKYLGQELHIVEKEFAKKKSVYCRSCGSLCISKIKPANLLFDEDTGKQTQTYFIETKCPVKGLSLWKSKIGYGREHTGHSYDPD